MDRWVNIWMDVLRNGCVGWTEGWMYGGMDRWMNGWMCQEMDVLINAQFD